MYIKLRWTNKNKGSFTTKIYRTDTPVPKESLPAALVTLSNGESEWIDTTAVRGKQYYYTFQNTNINGTLYSNPIPVKAVPPSGPGPADLLIGDESYGYYGTLTGADLLSPAQLFDRLNLGTTNVGTVPSEIIWDKWVRNGKVLFVPRSGQGSVTWNALYAAGVVYGVEGPGPNRGATAANAPTPARNQLVTVKVGVYRLIARLPTGYDDRDNPNRQFVTTNSMKFSEVIDLWQPLMAAFRDEQRMVNVPLPSTVSFNGWCQEREAGTSIYAANNLGARTTVTSGNNWFPVLELVPEPDFTVTV